MTFFFFIILGIVLMVVSFVNQDYHKELMKTGKYAEGIVFDQSVRTDTSSSTNSLLNTEIVIRFTTEDKTWITGTMNQTFSTFFTGQYKVGQKVDVYYDPEKPSRFFVHTKQSPILARVLMFVVGLFFLLSGLYLASGE
jgi:hypothetical protein